MYSMLILGLCLLTLPIVANAESWCFACEDAAHPAYCKQIMACSTHDSCYVDKHAAHTGTPQFTSGCKPTSDCRNLNRTERAVITQCTECCKGTLCNLNSCGAEVVDTKDRLWCADCQYQNHPNDCGKVKLCSQDELCSVSRDNVFDKDVYSMACTNKGLCIPGSTLEKNNSLCCDTSLCNTNFFGTDPAIYTPPPPTTTPPPPSPANVSIDNATIDFISHHKLNETLTIVCHIAGYPIPNVTWTFTPEAAGGSNSSTNDTSLGATDVPAANVTLGTNVTTSNHTDAPQSQEITRGVTTSYDVSTLEIMDPVEDNAGVYVCSASNGNGSVNASVVVTVRAVPLISGDLNQTIAIDARTDVLLDCNVTGSPAPNVTWRVPQTAGGVEHLANDSVLLHNVHSDNTGTYLCVAENSAGVEVKSVTLLVTDNATEACPSVSPPSPIATPLTRGSHPGYSSSVDDQSTRVTLPATVSPVSLVAMGSVWNSLTKQPFILQCQVPGSTTLIPITWSRLEQDFHHNDSAYIDNGQGTLVISLSAPSLTATGVFECRVAAGGSGNVQHFVIYKELPTNLNCTDKFSIGTPSPGTVLRATCGPCSSTQQTAAALTKDSLVCESAEKRGVLPPSGGAVTWLIRNNGEVSLLADDQGAVKIVP